MVEGTIKSGHNESFPLLKENSLKGCGDCSTRSPLQAEDNNSTHQSILIEDKKSWLPQWTGLLTVCWILSFVLAMGLAGQILASCFVTTFAPHALMLSPCYFNESVRSNQLFLIQYCCRNVETLQYAAYLSHMARTYQNLNITVIFLLEYGSRHNGFKNLFYGSHSNWRPQITDENDRAAQHMLTAAFPNLNFEYVNISSLLSRRMLPSFAIFYAKVYYMWMYGGVALDLLRCYFHYINNYHDYRYMDMLQFFNDNVNIEAYKDFLERVDDYQETEGQVILASRFEIVFNPETTNRTNETAAARTKREDNESFMHVLPLNRTNITETEDFQLNMNTSGEDLKNSSYFSNLSNATTVLTYLYDIAILQPIKAIHAKSTEKKKQARSLVVIDSDGMFIASSAPRHPFIGDIMKTYNKHSLFNARTRISYVIKNVYLVTCRSKFEAPYCGNVYIL